MTVRKRFGQHFLHDPNTISRILNAIHPVIDDHIVELGPGRGALTRGLVECGCQLQVIEIDRDLSAELQRKFACLDVICSDALSVDYTSLKSVKPFRVIGNLPYNISTPLLFRLYSHKSVINDMTFMLQEEVVDRICASPGTSAYGRLSIMSQYHCMVEKLFTVPPESFKPMPRVTSAMIRLTPHQQYKAVRDIVCLQEVLICAFNARRKTIRNALNPLLSEDDLDKLGIDSGIRPDQIGLEDYIRCADLIWEHRQR